MTTRLPATLFASGTLLFNVGVFSAAWRHATLTQAEALELDFDPSAGAAIASTLATLLLRWSACNVAVASCGLVGIYKANPRLIRFFALGSLLDWLAALLVLLSTLLLTFSPSLSRRFSDLLCEELTRGELFGATTSLREREGRAGTTGWGMKGVEVVVWGVESCEENWRQGMVLLLGIGVAVVLVRAYGVWVAFEHAGEVERSTGGLGGRCSSDWFDARDAKREKMQGRRRGSTVSMGRPTRSTSLPPVERPPTHGRFKSHSLSHPPPHHPRLVLVPVFFDPFSAPPVTSPSSYHPHPSKPRTARRLSSSSSTSSDPAAFSGTSFHQLPTHLLGPSIGRTGTLLTSSLPSIYEDVIERSVDVEVAVRRLTSRSETTGSGRRSSAMLDEEMGLVEEVEEREKDWSA